MTVFVGPPSSCTQQLLGIARSTANPPGASRYRTCLGSRSTMHRSLLVAGALCCLPACFPSPNAPGLAQPTVTGEWSGTFESSWGVLPVRASLRNEAYTPSISGEFKINGQFASGTVSGSLETRDRYSGTMFWGSLTISYLTTSGEMCRSESSFTLTSGSASEQSVSFSTEGFPRGNCPDPPTNVRITLRR